MQTNVRKLHRDDLQQELMWQIHRVSLVETSRFHWFGLYIKKSTGSKSPDSQLKFYQFRKNPFSNTKTSESPCGPMARDALKAKKQRCQEHGNDSYQNRQRYSDFKKIGKFVSAGTINHQIGLITCGADKGVRSAQHNANGERHEADAEIGCHGKGDRKHQGHDGRIVQKGAAECNRRQHIGCHRCLIRMMAYELHLLNPGARVKQQSICKGRSRPHKFGYHLEAKIRIYLLKKLAVDASLLPGPSRAESGLSLHDQLHAVIAFGAAI